MGEFDENEIGDDGTKDDRPWYAHYDAAPKIPPPSWLDEVEWTEPEGTVKVYNSDWDWWDMYGRRGGEEEPPKFLEWSYAKAAEALQGWKLHLKFDRADTERVDQIASFLIALRQRRLISSFKIGHGEAGKDATVYVGHHDKAALSAGLIERGLGEVLDNPDGDTLVDDTPFAKRVMARFEVGASVAHDFNSYGTKGFPILRADFFGFDDIPGVERETSLRKTGRESEIIKRAHDTLEERFGEFFTGKQAT